MLIESFEKPDYKSIELRTGSDGQGKKLFSVQSKRDGEKGEILHIENFYNENEARAWVKFSL